MRRLACVLFVVAAGCKPKSLKLADELDRSSSWLAAVAEIGRTTAQNSTPIGFAENAIEDASAELNKSASKVEKIHVASDIERDGKRLILAAEPKLDELRSDLEAAAADMHGNLAWLKAASDTLSDLSERARKARP